jgi:histidine triad (HIT) family protein
MSCIFCKIAAGEAPAEVLFQDEVVTVIQDKHPQAPVHLLILPNRHIRSLNETSPDDASLLGHMLLIAREIAAQHGIDQRGYRLVINTEREGGQSVFHLHAHLLGGKRMPFSGGG